MFSWLRTYTWSRVWGNGDSCVQSALMALEAWAHRRVEEDGEVDSVLADVLPPAGGPAAYLLVAVDVVLSHWPKSRKAAVPFLACPELLCLDLQTTAADKIPIHDFFGLDALFGTTDDPSSSNNLKARPSRQLSLDSLLGRYAISGPSEIRSEIAGLLQQAVERLGPYGEDANQLNPKFMAAHARNLLNPAHWRKTSTMGPSGKAHGAWTYVPPLEEEQHFERLRASTSLSSADLDMQFAVLRAVEEPSGSSPEFVSQAMDWVFRPAPPITDDAWDKAGRRNLAIIAAAVIAMRDGDSDLRACHRAWARGVFLEALTAEADNSLVPESNISFQPCCDGVYRHYPIAPRGHRFGGYPRSSRSRLAPGFVGGIRLSCRRRCDRLRGRALAARFAANSLCVLYLSASTSEIFRRGPGSRRRTASPRRRLKENSVGCLAGTRNPNGRSSHWSRLFAL